MAPVGAAAEEANRRSLQAPMAVLAMARRKSSKSSVVVFRERLSGDPQMPLVIFVANGSLEGIAFLPLKIHETHLKISIQDVQLCGSNSEAILQEELKQAIMNHRPNPRCQGEPEGEQEGLGPSVAR